MSAELQSSCGGARVARLCGSTARALLTSGILLIVVPGCSGSGGAPSVDVAPVTGTVRYNGVPIAGARVQFTQQDCPIVAGGITDDAGEFELTSLRQGDGAPVGENQVAIFMPARAADDSNEFKARLAEAEANNDPNARAEIKRARREQTDSAARLPPRIQLPKKYSSADTSGLSFTVEAGTQNQCEFDLTD
jgi:hypothetical protein